MGYIRFVNLRYYDAKLGRFQSLAFRNSNNDGGISVVDRECSQRASPGICEHIEKFYKKVAGSPAAFWEIPPELLHEGCSFDPEPSDTGDNCHYNLMGMTDNQAKAILKNWRLEDI